MHISIARREIFAIGANEGSSQANAPSTARG